MEGEGEKSQKETNRKLNEGLKYQQESHVLKPFFLNTQKGFVFRVLINFINKSILKVYVKW